MWLHESSRTIGRDNWLVVEQDNHTEHLISPSPTTRATWRGSHSSCTHSASFHGSPLYCNAASPTVSLAYLSRFYTPQQKWCRTCSYSTASIKTGCLLWSSVRRQSKICTYKGPQRKKNKELAHTIFRMMQHLFLPTKKNRTKAEAHFPPEVAVWWVLQVSIFSST